MKQVPGKSGGLVRELQGGCDTCVLQFGFRPAPDAPYIAYLKGGQGFLPLFLRAYLANTVVTGVFLGVLACHFRQRLTARDTDGDGYAYAPADIAYQLLAVSFLLRRGHMVDIDKTLVYRVLLKPRGVLAEDGHDAVG